MFEKTVAMRQITDCRSTLKAVEDSIAAAIEANGDDFGLKAAIDAHHEALAKTEAAYLRAREWTLDPDIRALSGGENKPPREDEPEAPGT